MKRIFTLLCLMFAITAYSQQYNNEWIDYSKVHYKFKIGQTGLYRIPATVLSNAGLGSTPVEQFRLFRNGVQVPVYITSASGPIDVNGYIEFWGEMNDGKPDKALYRDPAFQHSDKYSLQTDTAMFFLTTGTGSNLRLTDRPNNIASATAVTEPYFMYTTGNHFRNVINKGFARNAGEYIYSSSYDQGEYWSSNDIYPASPLTDNIGNLSVYPGGPQGYVRFGASGNAQNRRKINVKLNNSQLFDSEVSIFEDVNSGPLSFPVSLISGGIASMVFTNAAPEASVPAVVNDRMVISYYDITYPRKFDFGGNRNFPFSLPAKNDGYLLAITNFNKGAVKPVLYDLTAGSRYVAEYSAIGDSVKFALPPSGTDHQFVLVSEEASNITQVAGLSPRTFTDYSVTSQQGDYIIISNALLYTNTDGRNPVADYRDYRRSANGGSYNAVMIEIDELVDQYAFGIKKHPSSVKNFLRFAHNNFSVGPKFAFLIGKGMDYETYQNNRNSSIVDQLNLVPTFGSPGSDNFLGANDAVKAIAVVPIGRLSAVHPYEVADYLEKVQEYETAQRTAPYTLKDRLWMKNVMHVTGASQSELGMVLCSYMDGYSDIIKDTLTGANVHTFCKSSASPVEQISSQSVSELFEEGLSMVTYFGHSSSSTLEFNIDNPENYNSEGKYPVFSVNGCNAGNFFTYDPQRLQVNETLSEKFVLAKRKGAIAFLASTHFGIVNYLNIYLDNLYRNIASRQYGKSLGQTTDRALESMLAVVAPNDFFARCHSEQITLHGDPALKMNFQQRPDYIIESQNVKASPSFISIAENFFDLGIKMYNIGEGVSDSVTLEVKRQYPAGNTEIIYSQKMKRLVFADSLTLKVPVIGTRDKGTNRLTVTIDPENAIDEISEDNNSITKDVFIYEDEARASFPYNYSIVSDPNQKLIATTANPFSPLKNYLLEVDTTELFSSPMKVSKEFSASGGILEVNPGIVYKDSTVYYWRVATKVENNALLQWNNSSFTFIANSSEGAGQLHYFQHLKSEGKGLSLNADRKWHFGNTLNNLFIRNTIFGTGGNQNSDFTVSINNDASKIISACVGYSLLFNVFDPVTFKPWTNVDENGNNLYLSGSGSANCGGGRSHNFEFSHTSVDKRKLIARFMDSIPVGSYVVVRTFDYTASSNAPIWQSDTTFNGHDNSIYHRLVNAGFADLSDYNRGRAFIFVYRKGDPSFSKHAMTNDVTDKVNVSIDCPTPDSLGYLTSPVFGPARSWKSVHWKGSSQEPNSPDNLQIDVTGIDKNGLTSVLFTLDKDTHDLDISSVDANLYPSIQLKMRNVDSILLTPYQLKYWSLDFDPVAEGAIAPNLFFISKDTLEIGEILNFGVAFKNISTTRFDSIKVASSVIDNNNVSRLNAVYKVKPLLKGDTVLFKYPIDSKNLVGNNTLYVDFNPDNDQKEQYHFNNFVYRSFYVKPDITNPLLDVTFDGVHILNRDIVSSKPHIQIKVKDEAKYLLLDTSSIKELSVRFPDENGTIRTYKFGTDTLRYTAATNGADNTVTIDFSPYFPTIVDAANQPLNPDGDEYELTVKGNDKSGNNAGNKEFKVSFKVIDKPMISNLLNYPNPFTTSTAFVFTLTGSEVPQNMKIQILTVTGKIVREITKQELGPIHIGRNITEFKWDGKDQYGQRLGNGVYLYRVITTLNNKKMDKYRSEGDNTDQYFNKGYGKMYLMR